MENESRRCLICEFIYAINSSPAVVSEVTFNRKPMIFIDSETDNINDFQHNVDGKGEFIRIYVHKPVKYTNPACTSVLLYYTENISDTAVYKKMIINENDLKPRVRYRLSNPDARSLLAMLSSEHIPMNPKKLNGISMVVEEAYSIIPVVTDHDLPCPSNEKMIQKQECLQCQTELSRMKKTITRLSQHETNIDNRQWIADITFD